jgi:hypothetical protein
VRGYLEGRRIALTLYGCGGRRKNIGRIRYKRADTLQKGMFLQVIL